MNAGRIHPARVFFSSSFVNGAKGWLARAREPRRRRRGALLLLRPDRDADRQGLTVEKGQFNIPKPIDARGARTPQVWEAVLAA
jgi:hypothetical protein